MSLKPVLAPVLAGVMLATALAGAAFAGMADQSGSFEGRSRHVTMGTGQLVEEDGRYFVVLGEDFSLDSGPDPRVALGRDGYQAELQIAPLENLTGAQRYEVPASFDLEGVNQIWIWCEAAGVPLGVAALN